MHLSDKSIKINVQHYLFPMLLLAGLTIFGLGSMFFSTQFFVKQPKVAQERTGNQGEEVVLDGTPDLLIRNSDGSFTQVPVQAESSATGEVRQPEMVQITPYDEDTGEVLSAGSPNCRSAVDYPFQPLCREVEAQYNVNVPAGNYGSGSQSVRIRNNVNIEIYSITFPAILFGGTDESKLNDSMKKLAERQQIGCATGYFPSSGVIGTYGGERFFSPGSAQVEEVRDIKEGSTDNVGLNVCTELGGEGCEPDKRSKLLLPGVSEHTGNITNPSAPNLLSSKVTGGNYAPGAYEDSRDYDPGACEVFEINEARSFPSKCNITCLSKAVPVDFFKFIVANASQFAECAANPGSNACATSDLVALRVDAIYGTSYKCEEGYCARKMGDTHFKTFDTPNSDTKVSFPGVEEKTSEPQVTPYYIETACRIRINYSRIVDIPCLWDVTPYYTEYVRQRSEYSPNDKNICSFAEWWEMIEKVARDLNQCG